MVPQAGAGALAHPSHRRPHRRDQPGGHCDAPRSLSSGRKAPSVSGLVFT